MLPNPRSKPPPTSFFLSSFFLLLPSFLYFTSISLWEANEWIPMRSTGMSTMVKVSRAGWKMWKGLNCPPVKCRENLDAWCQSGKREGNSIITLTQLRAFSRASAQGHPLAPSFLYTPLQILFILSYALFGTAILSITWLWGSYYCALRIPTAAQNIKKPISQP